MRRPAAGELIGRREVELIMNSSDPPDEQDAPDDGETATPKAAASPAPSPWTDAARLLEMEDFGQFTWPGSVDELGEVLEGFAGGDLIGPRRCGFAISRRPPGQRAWDVVLTHCDIRTECFGPDSTPPQLDAVNYPGEIIARGPTDGMHVRIGHRGPFRDEVRGYLRRLVDVLCADGLRPLANGEPQDRQRDALALATISGTPAVTAATDGEHGERAEVQTDGAPAGGPPREPPFERAQADEAPAEEQGEPRRPAARWSATTWRRQDGDTLLIRVAGKRYQVSSVTLGLAVKHPSHPAKGKVPWQCLMRLVESDGVVDADKRRMGEAKKALEQHFRKEGIEFTDRPWTGSKETHRRTFKVSRGTDDDRD